MPAGMLAETWVHGELLPLEGEGKCCVAWSQRWISRWILTGQHREQCRFALSKEKKAPGRASAACHRDDSKRFLSPSYDSVITHKPRSWAHRVQRTPQG